MIWNGSTRRLYSRSKMAAQISCFLPKVRVNATAMVPVPTATSGLPPCPSTSFTLGPMGFPSKPTREPQMPKSGSSSRWSCHASANSLPVHAVTTLMDQVGSSLILTSGPSFSPLALSRLK